MATEKLISYVYDTIEDELSFMQFYHLHRLNLARMQNELAICKADILATSHIKDEDLRALTVKLHDYGNKIAPACVRSELATEADSLNLLVNAIRDCEYMRQLKPARGESDARTFLMGHFPGIATRNGQDPYNSQICQLPGDPVNNLNDPLRQFLKRVLPKFILFGQRALYPAVPQHLRDSPLERTSDLVDQLARFILAFFGGASLVVPMMIMSLNPSQTKSLVTVSLAVLFVSFAMSVGIRCNNAETLAVTAAYAAVLVVFIGASSTTQSPTLN